MSFHDHLVAYIAAIDGDAVISAEAEKFLAMMNEQHPGELATWLADYEVVFVADEMRRIMRSQRARDRAREGARAFAEHYSLDDTPEPDDPFAVRYCVNGDNVWRSVADMRGDDHRYVAGQYEVSGKRALVRAAFHEAVAKKIGNKRTADVFSVDKYEALRRQIEGE